MSFDYASYNKTKIECPICEGKWFARANAPGHKATKKHLSNLKALVDTLTPDEKTKIKKIIEKVNHEDLIKKL